MSEPNVEVEITLSLRPELAARFDGRLALVTPVSRSEVRRLHQLLAAMRDFAALTARSMATLKEVLDTTGDTPEQIARTLRMMIEPSRSAVAVQAEIEELLSRSFIAGGKGGAEPGPDPKGAVQ